MPLQKMSCAFLLAFLLFGMMSPTSLPAQAPPAQAGDIWLWMPFDPAVKPVDAQIVRNSQYVSIKLQAAHLSYRSGFLENIKQIVVSSSVTFGLPEKAAQGTNINRTWEKSNKAEDSIPVNDLLAVLSPATPNNIALKVSFSGIGQDKFKPLFDVFSNGDIKTTLDLSPATLAKATLATSIIQKLLATPYTSANPKDVLSMSQAFVIYADRASLRADSLREGYIVVISGSEAKSADLSRLLSLPIDHLQFDANYHVLRFKQADGAWQPFTGNSYVVLSVTQSPIRGVDENSAWGKKFSTAVQNTEKLNTGAPAESVKKECDEFWTQGVTLLSADENYIDSERRSIRAQAYRDILDGLKNRGGVKVSALLSQMPQGLPANFEEVAKSYQTALNKVNLNATLRITLGAMSGTAIANRVVLLENTEEPRQPPLKGVTNSDGVVEFNGVKPGAYSIEGAQEFGWHSRFDVKPTEDKSVNITVPNPM